VRGCILERVTPSGKNALMAVSIIYFLLSLMALDPFLFFDVLASLAEDPI